MPGQSQKLNEKANIFSDKINSFRKSYIKPALSFLLLAIMNFSCKTLAKSSRVEEKSIKTVLEVSRGSDNPRNSEGDFITLKDRRILFVYSHFTGSSGGDYGNAYLASRISLDNGRTWSQRDQSVLSQEGDINVMSVSLLRLQNGEIALFYLRKNSKTDCIPMVRLSIDEAKSWSNPQPCITDKKGYFVLNNDRVIQLRNGRLLMAVQLLNNPLGSLIQKGGIWSYYSDDNGKHWRSGTEVPNPDRVVTQEPGVTELKNGDIYMNIRTNSGAQYISYSKDKGVTWSASERSNIVSPLSPATIKRIPSTGDLLLVWNNNGENDKRTPLNIALSKDEGKTWTHIKTLEDDPNGRFCYTAIHFTDKNVLLGYSNWRTMGTTIKRISLNNWIYK